MNKRKRKNAEISAIPWYVVCGAAIALIAVITAVVLFIYRDANGDEEFTGDWGEEFQIMGGDDFEIHTPTPEPNPIIAEMVENNVPVALANGREIGAGDITFRLNEAEWATRFREGEDPRGRAILEEAVRLSAIPVMVEIFAEAHGIYLSRDDLENLDQQIEMMKLDFGGAEGLAVMLLEYGIYGVAEYERIIASFTLMEMVAVTIMDDPDKFEAFEQYMQEVPELLGAMHILLQPDNFDSEEEAEALANDLLARLRDGEDFAALRDTYGQDPGQPPQGYTFSAGVMDMPFYEAAKALEIGEISDIVRGHFGFHILLRTEPVPEEAMLPGGGRVPTLEDRMFQAVMAGFEAKANAADLVFLPELYNIPVVY